MRWKVCACPWAVFLELEPDHLMTCGCQCHEVECPNCEGVGFLGFPTLEDDGGLGFETGPCDRCFGTGDHERPGPELLKGIHDARS